MPARATRLYILTDQAHQTGLIVAVPPWWDSDRLFADHADRKISFPEHGDVLFLEWHHLLSFDLKTGAKRWKVPERKPLREEEPIRRALLDRLQDAEWVIVGRERLWVVPERSQPGCAVHQTPPWWRPDDLDGEPDLSYEAFWQKAHEQRCWRRAVPWQDHYAYLFAGREIKAFDDHMREGFLERYRQRRWKMQSNHRTQMKQLARVLQDAIWVVLLDHEWESGLA